jgi:Zn finger protein HypA/HybF involved in hydrogenase expression
MTKTDYWKECIADAASECELELTGEQLAHLAECAEGAHDNYGMASYQPESPYPREIKRLEKELEVERSKVVCPDCAGSGRRVSYGGTFMATGPCSKCHGDGKVVPV